MSLKSGPGQYNKVWYASKVHLLAFALAAAGVVTLLNVAHISASVFGALENQDSQAAKPIPADRAEMLRALESLKARKPRLPIESGGRGGVGNGAARRTYLPSAWHAADFRGDAAMTLDRNFKVRLFWIAARANNCHYCLGHQEIKLKNGGMISEELAALDSAWEVFPEAEQAAFAYAKKLTLEPHAVTAADVDALRAFYSDAQIVEITHVIANYNSVNRWTDGLGLPQETERVFDDPQSVIAVGTQSLVAPAGEVPRPLLCGVEEAKAALADARLRRPRVKLPDELPAALGESIELPQHWLQMISYFPTLAQTQATAARSIANDGTLPLSLKAEAAWLSARHNRAWYALDHACKQLREIGWTDDEIFQLDDPATCPKLNDAERGALELVRKLTVAPQFITDADIERLQGPWSDQQIAELVFVTCAANQFDRFTEALGLPLDQ